MTPRSKWILLVLSCLALGAVPLPAAPLAQEETPEITEAGFTRITSDGPLKIDYARQVADFSDNVRVVSDTGTLRADQLTVKFDEAGLVITEMIARGNVVIDESEHYSESKRADFIARDNTLKLTGNPVIRKGPNFYAADIITIFLDTNKVTFEPSARIVVRKDDQAAAGRTP